MNTLSTRNPEVGERYDFMMETVHSLGELAWDMINAGDVRMQLKPDGTKVTNVDETLNDEFIRRVEDRFNGDLVWGEERSNSEKNNIALANHNWMWLIDPIDGTNGFWRSYRNERFKECTSTIMVTAFAPGETIPTMSNIHNPFQDREMTISAHSGLTFFQTADDPTAQIVNIDQSRAPKTMREVQRYEQTDWKVSNPNLKDFHELVPRARLVDHQLFMGSIALGDVDVSVFPGPSNPHDVSPGALIVHNAGGDVRTFSNERFASVDWRRYPIHGTIGSANPALSREVVDSILQQQLVVA